MTVIEWNSLLIAELSIPPGIAAELTRQLISHARTLAGVALDDGRHAFVPSGQAFAVRYDSLDGLAIASVEGDLIGRDAWGHPAVLAWGSRTGADLRLTPDRGASDLHFFWLTFPAFELANPKRADARDWLANNQFGFDVDVELYTLPDISLQFVARAAFTVEDVGVITASIGAAIGTWNQREQTRVHYCGVPEITSERDRMKMHIDLGGGGLGALAEILFAVGASSAGAAISRCAVTG